MRLHHQEQTYYALPDLHATDISGATVSTPVTSWEASYDRGTTWHAAQPHPDQPTTPCWLIRGPSYPGSGDTDQPGGITLTASITPLIRLRDTPETTLETAPRITLWG